MISGGENAYSLVVENGLSSMTTCVKPPPRNAEQGMASIGPLARSSRAMDAWRGKMNLLYFATERLRTKMLKFIGLSIDSLAETDPGKIATTRDPRRVRKHLMTGVEPCKTAGL